jgi:hypothetical protein
MKKTLLLGGIVLLIILVVLIFYFVSSKPAAKCDPYADISVTMKNGDVTKCDCFEDVEKRNICQGNISDGFLYTKAIKESNLLMCEKITTVDMKNACQDIVKGRLDFAQQNKVLTATSSKK